MNKKYTIDTPLNPKAWEYYEVFDDIITMKDLEDSFSAMPFEHEFEGIVYLINIFDGKMIEVIVDLKGKQESYSFEEFEDFLNAHIIKTDKTKVVGDLIIDYNNR